MYGDAPIPSPLLIPIPIPHIVLSTQEYGLHKEPWWQIPRLPWLSEGAPAFELTLRKDYEEMRCSGSSESLRDSHKHLIIAASRGGDEWTWPKTGLRAGSVGGDRKN